MERSPLIKVIKNPDVVILSDGRDTLWIPKDHDMYNTIAIYKDLISQSLFNELLKAERGPIFQRLVEAGADLVRYERSAVSIKNKKGIERMIPRSLTTWLNNFKELTFQEAEIVLGFLDKTENWTPDVFNDIEGILRNCLSWMNLIGIDEDGNLCISYIENHLRKAAWMPIALDQWIAEREHGANLRLYSLKPTSSCSWMHLSPVCVLIQEGDNLKNLRLTPENLDEKYRAQRGCF